MILGFNVVILSKLELCSKSLLSISSNTLFSSQKNPKQSVQIYVTRISGALPGPLEILAPAGGLLTSFTDILTLLEIFVDRMTHQQTC